MSLEDMEARGVGGASRFATSVVLILLAFTLGLVILSFPAGLYAVFHGGLSSSLSYGSLVTTYFWVGPVLALFPFTVYLGGIFLVLTVVYALLFLFGFMQEESPLSAFQEAFRSGVGSLLSSPFVVIMVSIGFLNFTAIVVSAIAAAAAGPVGNPFSSVDPLLEFGSLTFAPLREELGFRVVLIGLVAFVLSFGRSPRDMLRALWRPSAAYQGVVVGGATSLIIWIATGASAATFGLCHITCGGGSAGWNWSKLPEATWGGVVLGYLYVRYGLHVAILTHWGVDYLGSAFTFFGQAAYGIPVSSTNTEFAGQYLVDLDMLLLFGLACFLLVAYLGLRRLLRRKGAEAVVVDKGLPGGGAIGP